MAVGAIDQIEPLRSIGYTCLAVQAKTLLISGGREFVKAFKGEG